MELKVIEQNESKLILELGGETVGFANLLRKELWKEKSVKEAAYSKPHPYLSQPRVFIATNKGSPVSALEKTVKEIDSIIKDFKESFNKALKK